MRLKNEKDYSAWVIYVFIAVFILVIDSLGWLSGIKSVGDKLINPISGVVRTTTRSALKPIQMIKFISSGPQRILDLESRYAEAIVSLQELETIKKENQTLKKLLGNTLEENYTYKPASVVGGADEIVVSSGTSSGLEAGDTVVDAANVLVGRIVRISTYTSWVITPKYHLNKIPVIIGADKIPGFLVSMSEKVEIDVEQSDRISLNDFVFTSGINNEYIPNMLIGKVSFIEKESANIYKKIKVDLLSNPQDTVFIVKAKK